MSLNGVLSDSHHMSDMPRLESLAQWRAEEFQSVLAKKIRRITGETGAVPVGSAAVTP